MSALAGDSIAALDAAGSSRIATHEVHWRMGAVPGADRVALSAMARAWLEELVTARQLFAWNGLLRDPATNKPRPAGADHADVSISHSGPLVLVAACADARIGVDIETEPFVAFDSAPLVRRMCTAPEARLATSLDHGPRRRYLAAVWTAKEALTKATGAGLATDFRTLDSGVRSTDAVHPFEAHVAVMDHSAGFHLHRLDPAEHHA